MCKHKSKIKSKAKTSKGITLIALIITIVVLIILAGVAINLTLSQNGIFNKATKARKNYMQATNEEQEGITNVELAIDEITGGKSNSDIEQITSGSYDNPYIPTGFTHIGTEDWNSGYRISDTENENGNIFVWVPCVLDQSKVKEGDKVQTFQKIITGKYNSLSFSLSSTDASVTDVEPTNAIRTSVGRYGGFYIAAYETGIEGKVDNYNLNIKTATDGSVKPLSKAGCGVWNYITRTDALTVAASMVNTENGVKSGLISGECWDTTLQWMVNSSTKATLNAGYDINSAGKGWYSNVSSNTRNITGYYGVNNIYDMAGNVYEWTTESCTSSGNSYIVLRGGCCRDTNGLEIPAAYRINQNDIMHFDLGFRVVLYK